MVKINIKIDNKNYKIPCKEEHVEHLQKLGNFVNIRAGEIKTRLKDINDDTLIVMISLLLADELLDLRKKSKHFKEYVEKTDLQKQELLNKIEELKINQNNNSSKTNETFDNELFVEKLKKTREKITFIKEKIDNINFFINNE